MMLVDTSIWIDHLRFPDADLLRLLEREEVVMHPFIIGEIALGSLRNREETLLGLAELPSAIVAEHGEVMMLLDVEGFANSGVGWVDTHLLCSARLTPECRLRTRDRRLSRVADMIGVKH